jgi:hypothetical protein
MEWATHDDESVDVAVIPFALPQVFDLVWLDVSEPYPRNQAYCGDVVTIVGLFRLREGVKKTC